MFLLDIFIRLLVVVFFVLEGIVMYTTYQEEKNMTGTNRTE